jgi:hypothetical protein
MRNQNDPLINPETVIGVYITHDHAANNSTTTTLSIIFNNGADRLTLSSKDYKESHLYGIVQQMAECVPDMVMLSSHPLPDIAVVPESVQAISHKGYKTIVSFKDSNHSIVNHFNSLAEGSEHMNVMNRNLNPVRKDNVVYADFSKA